ncbi:uncharacterized protein MAM_01425 [Metarhizium album ARSEF 1941]|uniref:Hydroxyacyl-thioester dehydratase-like protein n=1 Tax=Metarhizium album (strain ARSEF 1941) TaxID=1081103 RepID=A0A0B2WWP8_METAS|nr:uncharacterized protein MAM_01425 [Metarhizium album ARSEF 1941]KHO00647.1 hypothetical protein MAM_01425 [Metarhizium album ARSEF 1941]
MKRLPKRPALPPLASRRVTSQNRASSPPPSPPLIDDLQSRPPKLIPDYLCPMPSHLLTTTLCDLLHAPVSSSPTIQSPPEVLPQGHHLVYFPIQTAPSKLAPDGADPDHSPGPGFPRRMWAGGEVLFHKGWRERLVMDGRPWQCREHIGDVSAKGGAGGGGGGESSQRDKVFVDVWRQYGAGRGQGQGREWDIEERRTLVFMRAQEARAAPPPRRVATFARKASRRVRLVPTPTHLFHFSALTFNAHAIHVDPLYARSTDGHRDLLVHGPLALALMLNVLGGGVERISYRNLAPLYVNEELSVCVGRPDDGRSWDVWIEGPEGGLAVRGKAVMDT